MMEESYAAESDAFFERGFAHSPKMGIFRGLSIDATLRLCDLAWSEGVDLVEIPYQSPESLRTLEAVAAAARERGKPIGAGTILTAEQVRVVADLGIEYCVSPGLDLALGRACEDAGLFHLPGVATATDVTTAALHGYRWLKAFPASLLGPSWIEAMHGPFPDMKFVCTGGMSTTGMHEYLDAGARGIAIGGRWADADPRAGDPVSVVG